MSAVEDEINLALQQAKRDCRPDPFDIADAREAVMPVIKRLQSNHVLLKDHWWCTQHKEVHLGKLGYWNDKHRQYLFPVYVEVAK